MKNTDNFSQEAEDFVEGIRNEEEITSEDVIKATSSKSKAKKSKKSVKEIITERFVKAVKDDGLLPWQKTWSFGSPKNLISN